jgi:putative tryptophan/tyrosine transport system substrate-binding protein
MSDMKRREFITLLGGAAAAPMIWPRSACAQQDGPVARVGVIGPPLDYPAMRVAYPFFLADLRKLGFVEGRNLLVETRPVDESVPRVFAAANELVAWKADVLFAFGPGLALQAAAAARPPVPIVMGAANFDPIAKGYVQSLARPGGNVTGIISRWPELAAKQIELLQEAFPDRNRLGVLWDTQSADQFRAAEHEAKARRLVLRPLKLETRHTILLRHFTPWPRTTCRCLSSRRVRFSRRKTRKSQALRSSIGFRPSSSSSITSRRAVS